jgi:Flp pilus assembly pilin Flp
MPPGIYCFHGGDISEPRKENSMHAPDSQPVSTRGFLGSEHGATFYEAVLLAALVSVVCIIVLLALGKGI